MGKEELTFLRIEIDVMSVDCSLMDFTYLKRLVLYHARHVCGTMLWTESSWLISGQPLDFCFLGEAGWFLIRYASIISNSWLFVNGLTIIFILFINATR